MGTSLSKGGLTFFQKKGTKVLGVAYVGTGATLLIQNNGLAKVWGAAYKWMFPLHAQ